VGFGRRDVPIDDQLPFVLGRYGHDRRRSNAPGVRVTKLNDQHAFLQVPEELQVGHDSLICKSRAIWPIGFPRSGEAVTGQNPAQQQATLPSREPIPHRAVCQRSSAIGWRSEAGSHQTSACCHRATWDAQG
jgi:hypothetical protein